MSKLIQLDRRSFLKTASLSAVGGSLASVTNIGSAAETGSGGARNGKYNFNEIYDRDGTGNIKWDSQYARFGAENIDSAMGIACLLYTSDAADE